MDDGGKIGKTGRSRRRDPFMTGLVVATALLVVLSVTGYFAVWLQIELPWMTEAGEAVLFWAYFGILFVGWPLAIRRMRKRRRLEDAEAIERAREALAGRGVRVERPTGQVDRGDQMSLSLPSVRDYRHMPWTNANVKSEDRP